MPSRRRTCHSQRRTCRHRRRRITQRTRRRITQRTRRRTGGDAWAKIKKRVRKHPLFYGTLGLAAAGYGIDNYTKYGSKKSGELLKTGYANAQFGTKQAGDFLKTGYANAQFGTKQAGDFLKKNDENTQSFLFSSKK